MAIREIESYRSALQISEQAKNRIRNGVDGQPARAAGQDSVEISRDGMERYKESLVKSATNGLNHNDNGTGVMMTDFHTLFGSRMPSIYGEKNENGEYVPHYFSAEETAANMKKVYAELHDEIVQGYKSGTRKTYVEDSTAESGYRKLTMDEELAALDKAYQEYSDRRSTINDKKVLDALSAQKSVGSDYLKGLQDRFPKMTFSVGTGFTGKTAQNTGDNANRWAFTVSPKLLEKMSADPEAEAEYMQKLRDIERATALADNFSKALGMKTTYCENYIDENGQLHHTSISVRKDVLNEKLRAEARENTEKMIERVREKNKEAGDKLEELLNKAEETGELTLGDKDMSWFSSAAKSLEALQKKDDAGSDEESGISAEQKKGRVGINAAKLASMLAAAKTRAQVQAVIAQIQSDLKECDAGKEQGLDVDEASVEAAKSVLQDAQSRMGQAENREATPEEEMASALASLM